ncbi:hypothetical protein SAY86_014812 [Trapa natans]|uniref:Auxin-responsive protein n=1 Tax=Trapa natans TaxID=22666 RepID=A0AAN7KN15_TRANT|nr:hypothetical protein SAY86_014812 [Trapa natans]
MAAESGKFRTIDFEETELRLGLTTSKGINGINGKSNYGKRGFQEDTVDLKLNLSSSQGSTVDEAQRTKETAPVAPSKTDPAKRPAKAQVVGWPPVRSFQKNLTAVKPASNEEADRAVGGAALVKVSMDGAPYLRKVDLKQYRNYQELSGALENMLRSFTTGSGGSQGSTKDFTNESRLIDLLNGSESEFDYVPTYEDKDGDWMLVGDVPWQMFIESCKRLRIMKGSEAIGLGIIHQISWIHSIILLDYFDRCSIKNGCVCM